MFGTVMLFLSAIFASLALGAGILYSVRRQARRRSLQESAADDKPLYRDVPSQETVSKSSYTSSSSLPEWVLSSDSENIDRAQWVLRMSRYVFKERHQSRYNVVVINQELEYHFDAEGIVERHHVKYYEPPNSRMVPYEITVFESGVLYNMGDGGDINWDWMGNFKRQGTSMLTFSPCESKVAYIQDPWIPSVE